MGNIVFRPDLPEHQLCGFNDKIFTLSYPELSVILYSASVSALLYVLLIAFVVRSRRRALLRADGAAATAVLLPSFLPVLYLGFVSSATQIGVLIAYSFICDSTFLASDQSFLSALDVWNAVLYGVFVGGYDWFTTTVAVLFCYPSVSKKSFARAAAWGLGVALVTGVISGVAVDWVVLGGALGRTFEYALQMVAVFLPCFVVLVLIFLYPRRHASSRAFLIHFCAWRAVQILAYAWSLEGRLVAPQGLERQPSNWFMVLMAIARTGVLPVFVYHTLVLDTQYWRGVTRRNVLTSEATARRDVSGSRFRHPEAAGGVGRWLAMPRYPPGDSANDRLQSFLDEAHDSVIDHAFLDVDYDRLLGRGASASVFRGRLTLLLRPHETSTTPRGHQRSRRPSALNLLRPSEVSKVEVAVKMLTPAELDVSSIHAFAEETRAWSELTREASAESRLASEEPSLPRPPTSLDDDPDSEEENRSRNLVRFYGFCVHPPHLSLVFEYCDGGALEDWIARGGYDRVRAQAPERREGLVSLETRLRVALDCARALRFVHETGYLHRDIKAANYLLRSGRALLTDFGTCARADGAGRCVGATVGTLDHWAPEIVRADLAARGAAAAWTPESSARVFAKEYSRESDVYALGVVLAGVLTLEKPFPGMRDWDVRASVEAGQPPFQERDWREGLARAAEAGAAGPELGRLRLEALRALKELIRRCWSHAREERPTALELCRGLSKTRSVFDKSNESPAQIARV